MPATMASTRAGLHPVHREVVEEVEGLGAVHEEVVHPHGDEVDAHGVVAVGEEGDFQLGSHPVGGRDQHRLLIAGGDAAEGGKGADAAQHLRTLGARRQPGDAAHRLVPGLDVHAGGSIGERVHGLRRQASNSLSCEASSGSKPTLYWPVKHAWQKWLGSLPVALSMPSSER